jgi:hypothetical protein
MHRALVCERLHLSSSTVLPEPTAMLSNSVHDEISSFRLEGEVTNESSPTASTVDPQSHRTREGFSSARSEIHLSG